MNQILIGDCRQTLWTLPAGCAHVCVTSPPYWNLRSYLPGDHVHKSLEIGSEPTPEQFVETMVEVFRGVRHAMRDDGLLFVNLGDSYAANGGAHGGRGDNQRGVGAKRVHDEGNGDQDQLRAPAGLKDGDQCNMPHRVATALQADGWYWRDTIIWRKPSPMPSSQNGVRWERCRVKVASSKRADNLARHGDLVRQSAAVASRAQREAYDPSQNWLACPGCDKCRHTGGYILRRGRFRTTTAHEYIFMFSKSKGYFADAERAKEPATVGSRGLRFDAGKTGTNGNGRVQAGYRDGETRLPRSVWTIAPEPYKAAHFATYPSDLVRRCLLMAVSAKGCCPTCGAQYAPVVETERVPTRPGTNTKVHVPSGWDTKAGSHGTVHRDGRTIEPEYMDRAVVGNRDPERHIQRSIVKDYWPTCTCHAGEPVPCTLLDPFGGSGTSAQAAQAMGCNWILCELNEEYAALARERIDVLPKWAKPKAVPRIKYLPGQMELFSEVPA